jgi:hypothetical protein
MAAASQSGVVLESFAFRNGSRLEARASTGDSGFCRVQEIAGSESDLESIRVREGRPANSSERWGVLLSECDASCMTSRYSRSERSAGWGLGWEVGTNTRRLGGGIWSLD